MMVIMDTGSVPDALRFYMPLLMEVILESPIMRDGGRFCNIILIYFWGRVY